MRMNTVYYGKKGEGQHFVDEEYEGESGCSISW